MQENTEEQAIELPKLYYKCRRCKRALSNPQAMKIGFGKVCAKKAGVTGLDPENVEASAGEVVLVPQVSQPFDRDVHVHRHKNGEALSNVPHTVIWHSPTGFEFGYGGSGPADLALNILNAFVPPGTDGEEPVECYKSVCSGTAARLHQQFKSDYIAMMPKTGGVILASQIKGWLRLKTGARV
jgi:hypothetical protein